MRSAKKKEGRPLPPKPEDKIWLEEFNEMTAEDHRLKLKQLGLDDEDINEFDEEFNGKGGAKDAGGQGAEGGGAAKGAKESKGKKCK